MTNKSKPTRHAEPILAVIVQQPPPCEDRWVVLEVFQTLLKDKAEEYAANVRTWEGATPWKTARVVCGKFHFRLDAPSESQREAAGTADEKPDGQAENASVEARQE